MLLMTQFRKSTLKPRQPATNYVTGVEIGIGKIEESIILRNLLIKCK